MALSINGLSLATLGITPRELTGWLDAPSEERSVLPLPNTLGVATGGVGTVSERSAMLVGTVLCSTTTERATKLSAIREQLIGTICVRRDDVPNMVFRALAGPTTVVSVTGNAWFQASVVITIPFRLTDVVSYDVEPRPIIVSSTPVQIPTGTAATVGFLHWGGAWSTGVARTLTYRGVNGISYGTLTLTPPASASLTSSEYLELDFDKQYITKIDSAGARTSAYDWKSGGAWFAIDPADSAVQAANRFPTLEISAGTGLFLYRRAWML